MGVQQSKGPWVLGVVVVIGMVIIAAVIYVEQAQRRIPVQYARRMVGRKMFGGSSTYIPLKVNQAGVIPVIFASSLLYLPAMIVQFNQNTSNSVLDWVNAHLVRGDHPIYMILFFALIVFFTYFYVSITFNPQEVADNMKKYGGFIPGIRAGKPTEEYLSYVLSRITLPGALYLGLVALIPLIAFAADRCQPELPVRRHQHPDHGRRRARHGEADREPAPAAQLRRIPPLMRLIIMGPPGAGKGTQAKFIAEHFKIPAISTGDIFRANVSEGTELGLEAKRYMDAGEYVPDEVTNLMVRNRIDEPDAVSGFLLDGYPRTLAQVEELDGMIKFTGHQLDAVVVPHRRPGRDRRAAAAARPGRGSRRRHRGRHPAPPGGLPRADRAADRGLPRPAASSTRSTASARSPRSRPRIFDALDVIPES